MYKSILALMFGAAVAACGGDTDPEPTDTGVEEVTPDVEADTDQEVTEEDTTPDVEEDVVETLDEVRITLSNINAELPVWVQTVGGRPWFTILDSTGTQVYTDASCGSCACGASECPPCETGEPETGDPESGRQGAWLVGWTLVSRRD